MTTNRTALDKRRKKNGEQATETKNVFSCSFVYMDGSSKYRFVSSMDIIYVLTLRRMILEWHMHLAIPCHAINIVRIDR
jgi:hypothetical protein